MKLIDEKGKLFGKLNIIDLAVVILIVGLIATFAIGKGQGPSNDIVKAQNQILETTIFINFVNPQYAKSIEVGEVVKVIGGKTLGKVTKIETSPMRTVIDTADGRRVETTDPYYLDMFITIQGDGVMNENTTDMGGNEVLIGEQAKIKTSRFRVNGYFYDVRVVK